MTQLNYISVNPKSTPTSTIIWLHGLGATSEDFLPVAQHLQAQPHFQSVRFILPQAPSRPITINQHMVMPGWYDILGLSTGSREDSLGLIASEQMLHDLIEQEKQQNNFSYENIFLAGFSQGGALALFTGLRFQQCLGGIIALSCYLPLLMAATEFYTKPQTTTPIFMAHGNDDPVVMYSWATTTYQLLKKWKVPISFSTYPMDHSVCEKEIEDIASWLKTQLTNQKHEKA